MQNKPQLFCFTFAGGTSAFYDEIEKDLPGYELIKPEYAGHGTRYKEQGYADFEELADDINLIVKQNYKGGPYALFGYSMGTITLMEVLRRILTENVMRTPQHVFLAAHEPHVKTELIGFSGDELDEWVRNRTVQFGTVPEKLLNNKTYWRVYLPVYRADYTLLAKYDFSKLDIKTDIPLTVFYSETDTPSAEIKKWRDHFVGQTAFYEFEGTHFFIRKHHKEMAEIINNEF